MKPSYDIYWCKVYEQLLERLQSQHRLDALVVRRKHFHRASRVGLSFKSEHGVLVSHCYTLYRKPSSKEQAVTSE